MLSLLIGACVERTGEEAVSELKAQNPRETWFPDTLFRQIPNAPYSPTEIKAFCQRFKTSPPYKKDQTFPQLISVLKQASALSSIRLTPRDMQVLAVLSACNPHDRRGRFLQVSTGEGKSLIVAMLAAIKALYGHQVDIMSTSDSLNTRDQKFNAFFEMLDLECGVLTALTSPEEYEELHKKPIIYSTFGCFTGEMLRENRKRSCDVLLIDEVDSLLIDNINKVTNLSMPVFGMEHLIPQLVFMWSTLKELIAKGVDQDTARQALLKLGHSFLDQHIRDRKVPDHLKSIARSQMVIWVESAISAFNQGNKQNHIVETSGKILHVDYQNTGVVQHDMVFSNGEHQFLQIKNLEFLEPESLLSMIMGPLTFVKYYKQLYGLTGTLGNEAARDFMHKIYGVNFTVVPEFKKKQLKKYPAEILETEEAWRARIQETIIGEAQKGRCVLVLFETIDELEKFQKRLEKSYPREKISIYARNDVQAQEQASLHRCLRSGEILLSTNLSGRGADNNVDDQAEAAGGLHVCITFIPLNDRVEEQAFGRTARQGRKGTGQMILNRKQVRAFGFPYGDDQINIENVLRFRDGSVQDEFVRKLCSEIHRTEMDDSFYAKVRPLLKSYLGKTAYDEQKSSAIISLWAKEFHFISTYEENIYAQQSQKLYEYAHDLGYSIGGSSFLLPDTIYQIICSYPEINISPTELRDMVLAGVGPIEPLMPGASDDMLFTRISRALDRTVILIDQNGVKKEFRGTKNPIYIGKLTGGVDAQLEGHPKPSYLLPRYVGMHAKNPEVGDKSYPVSVKEVLTEQKAIYQRLLVDYYKKYYDAKRAYAEPFVDRFLERVRHGPGPLPTINLARLVEDPPGDMLEQLDAAIAADPLSSHIAYYAKAFVFAQKGEYGYKGHTREALEKALDGISDGMFPWQFLLSTLPKARQNSSITRQVQGRLNYFKALDENIRKNLQIISQSTDGFQLIVGRRFDNFKDVGVLELDVEHLTAHNMPFFYNLENKPYPVSFLESLGMFLLGTIQTAVGAFLTYTGIGVTLGQYLMFEGVQDLWKSIKSFAGEAIDWSSYWAAKGFSAVLHIVGAAWKTIKEGVHTVREFGVKTLNNMIGPRVAAAGVGRNFLEKQALQTITVTVGNAVMRTVVSEGVGLAKRALLRSLRDDIESRAYEHLDQLKTDAHFIRRLNGLLAYAAITNTRGPKNELLRHMTTWRRANDRGALEAVEKVFQKMDCVHSDSFTRAGSSIASVALAGYSVQQIMSFFRSYCAELRSKVEQLYQALPTIETHLKTQTNVHYIPQTVFQQLFGSGIMIHNGGFYTYNQARPYQLSDGRCDGFAGRGTPMEVGQKVLMLLSGSPIAMECAKLAGFLRKYYDSRPRSDLEMFLEPMTSGMLHEVNRNTSQLDQMATDFACSQFDAGRRCVEQWMSEYEAATAPAVEGPAVVVAERPAGVIAPPPAAPRAAAAPVPTAVPAAVPTPAPAPVTPPPPPINPDTPFVRETLTAYRDLIDQNQVRELPLLEVPVRRARSVSPPRRTDTHICEARDWAVDTVVHYTPNFVKASVRIVGNRAKWVGENYPTLSHVAHTLVGGINTALHCVPELAGTSIRRSLRAVGVPQGIAQDAGDIISFAGDLIIPAAAVKGARHARHIRDLRRANAFLQVSTHPEFKHIFPKHILRQIDAKIPDFMPAVKKNREGLGFKWETKHGQNVVRIDRGDPSFKFAHQQIDHVRVNFNGQVIGRDGKVVLPTADCPLPKQSPNAHIPLDEWLNWESCFKKGGGQ